MARKAAGESPFKPPISADQAEENKNLARDIQDVYECEQWRLEADKQNENAKRYREERNKCKFFCNHSNVIIFCYH